MALENQNITTDEAVMDMANDFINNNTKQIWDQFDLKTLNRNQ